MKLPILFTLLLLSTQVSSQLLKIDMMVESLCPDCLHTVTKSFAPAIDAGLFQIADVTFVPYGNAVETQTGNSYSYKCQNTQDECYGNALYSCILKHMTDKQEANRALVCMFTAVNAKAKNFPEALTDCSKTYSFSASDVQACATNLEGNGLQHQAALATPKHNGVPWPVVEGKLLTDFDRTLINENVMKYACRNYAGDVKLQACEQYVLEPMVKLNMFWYVESLCPDSVHTVGKVNDAINKGLLNLADVDYVLAGNAKVTGNVYDPNGITCQHGPLECYGNALESCILARAGEAGSRVSGLMAVACIFAKTHTDGKLIDSALADCAMEYPSIDVTDVQQCANSFEGRTYNVAMIEATPAHTFIPWETVDQVMLNDADRKVLNEDPLKWACTWTKDSTIKTEVCGKPESARRVMSHL